jgi:hypothetical protein
MAAHLKNLTIAAGVTSLICAAVLYSINPQFGYWVYRCVAGADSKLACIYGDPSDFRTTTLGSVYGGNTADWIDRRVLLYGAYEMPELFFLRDVSSGGVMLDIGAHKASIRCSCQKYQKETTPLSPFRRYSNNSGSM